jgi:hypothetical protein
VSSAQVRQDGTVEVNSADGGWSAAGGIGARSGASPTANGHATVDLTDQTTGAAASPAPRVQTSSSQPGLTAPTEPADADDLLRRLRGHLGLEAHTNGHVEH